MSQPVSDDPFQILGLDRDAREDEVRARYLELVKQFPPERDPARFQAIHAAYSAAKNPISIARRLVEPPRRSDVPEWAEVIAAQRLNPPPLTPALLLSLGNRDEAEPR